MKLRRRLAVTVSCSAVVLALGCSSAARASIAPPPAPTLAPAPVHAPASTHANAASLDLALDSIKPENIKADIFFIASDDMGGRDTPSVGLRIAARYLCARLERLGWKPGAPEGYFFTYKLEQHALDPKASHVQIEGAGKTATLALGRDYWLARGTSIEERELKAGVVFCGAGTKEDFDAAQAKDKWALCLDTGVEPRKLRSAARDSGVLGLIVAAGPEYAGDSYAQRFAEDFERQKQGSVRYPADPKPADAKDKPAVEGFLTTLLLPTSSLERLVPQHAGVWTAPHRGEELAVTLTETRKQGGEGGLIDLQNVCGFWPGSDPELAKEAILVTAHYDHIGTQNGVVYNGADDNGSGTCGLMALAEALTHYGPMKRSVMIMWVSGEEKGLWGSKAWNAKPFLPDGCKAVADINIDMIGRNAPDYLLITPTKDQKHYNFLTRVAERQCELEGFPKLGSADAYYQRSDHYNFAQAGIPACFLFSDVHEDYHKPTDKPEKIDNDKIRRVVRMVLRMLDALQGPQIDS